ncbi:hypothetical protein BJX96DRAFT_148019, partial [Aspergillus floccosus]
MDYGHRPRGIILERMGKGCSARRIIAAHVDFESTLEMKVHEITRKLDEMLLSDFEKRWYRSLSIDRLQGITALHNLGITHRDIREDHFHLPKDFF